MKKVLTQCVSIKLGRREVSECAKVSIAPVDGVAPHLDTNQKFVYE
jgi:hypothetical protein